MVLHKEKSKVQISKFAEINAERKTIHQNKSAFLLLFYIQVMMGIGEKERIKGGNFLNHLQSLSEEII